MLKRKQLAFKPTKREDEGDVAADIPTDKRQKKITSLLRPAKESLHLRDEDSDAEVKVEDTARHLDETGASSM